MSTLTFSEDTQESENHSTHDDPELVVEGDIPSSHTEKKRKLNDDTVEETQIGEVMDEPEDINNEPKPELIEMQVNINKFPEIEEITLNDLLILIITLQMDIAQNVGGKYGYFSIYEDSIKKCINCLEKLSEDEIYVNTPLLSKRDSLLKEKETLLKEKKLAYSEACELSNTLTKLEHAQEIISGEYDNAQAKINSLNRVIYKKEQLINKLMLKKPLSNKKVNVKFSNN